MLLSHIDDLDIINFVYKFIPSIIYSNEPHLRVGQDSLPQCLSFYLFHLNHTLLFNLVDGVQTLRQLHHRFENWKTKQKRQSQSSQYHLPSQPRIHEGIHTYANCLPT